MRLDEGKGDIATVGLGVGAGSHEPHSWGRSPSPTPGLWLHFSGTGENQGCLVETPSRAGSSLGRGTDVLVLLALVLI